LISSKEHEVGLEQILEYNMNELEAKAFKCCLLWEDITKTELPDYRTTRLPRKGDPRKSLLFKNCYKLVRDTRGLIPDDMYQYYIRAQVTMLKSLSDGTIHALIEPGCLSGPKAWIRWKIWKNKFERQARKNNAAGDTSKITVLDSKVMSELTRTKNFFNTNFGENYEKEKIVEIINNKEIIKWSSFSKVSPFYLLLSPLIQKSFSDVEDSFSVDVDFYKKSITPDVEAVFKTMFSNEF